MNFVAISVFFRNFRGNGNVLTVWVYASGLMGI